jgi:hypothetical protein
MAIWVAQQMTQRHCVSKNYAETPDHETFENRFSNGPVQRLTSLLDKTAMSLTL